MEHLLGIDAGGWLDKGVTLVVAVVIAWLIERVVMRLMHKLLDASNLPSASLFINIARAIIWVLALLSVMRRSLGWTRRASSPPSAWSPSPSPWACRIRSPTSSEASASC